jgi:hypothetical protein
MKQPDDEEGGLVVLAEVTRAEGCVLAGKPYPSDEPADDHARHMNEEKERADAAVRLRLEEEELARLTKRVGSEGEQIPLRAPRLGQLILALEARTGKERLAPRTELTLATTRGC